LKVQYIPVATATMINISGKYFNALIFPPKRRLVILAPMRHVKDTALMIAVYGLVAETCCTRKMSLLIGVWVCASVRRWVRPSIGTSCASRQNTSRP
jgi:hypothetical protein